MTQNADLNRSTIHSDQNCYPCLRNKVLPMSQEGHFTMLYCNHFSPSLSNLGSKDGHVCSLSDRKRLASVCLALRSWSAALV